MNVIDELNVVLDKLAAMIQVDDSVTKIYEAVERKLEAEMAKNDTKARALARLSNRQIAA